MRSMGYLTLCESLAGNRVRLFFSDGLVIERTLSAHVVKIVDDGLGLRLRGGLEIGVYELRQKTRGCKSYDFSDAGNAA